MLELLKHIPAYQQWMAQASDERADDPASYRYYVARVHQSLVLLDLVWPEFVEIDGLILRKSAVPENWTEFKFEAQKARWSDTDIEYVVNHVHLLDFFVNDPDRDAIADEVYDELCHLIAEMWKCKLDKDFPDKVFIVDVNRTATEPEVYVYSVREKK